MASRPDGLIRAFGMTGMQITASMSRIERRYNIELGHSLCKSIGKAFSLTIADNKVSLDKFEINQHPIPLLPLKIWVAASPLFMGATEQTKIVCKSFVTAYFSLFHSFLPHSYIFPALAEKVVTKCVTQCPTPKCPFSTA